MFKPKNPEVNAWKEYQGKNRRLPPGTKPTVDQLIAKYMRQKADQDNRPVKKDLGHRSEKIDQSLHIGYPQDRRFLMIPICQGCHHRQEIYNLSGMSM